MQAMKRRSFLTAVPAITLLSCAREERRAKRYDEHECPFCTTKKGVCSYCKGTKKCSFCGGKGKRTTVVPEFPDKKINKSSYEETCPYCHGKGVCTYCNGSGICATCKGSGRIESWDFLK
jgi:DnaJ-class molecular chaperone